MTYLIGSDVLVAVQVRTVPYNGTIRWMVGILLVTQALLQLEVHRCIGSLSPTSLTQVRKKNRY
jgi:hypothetical protein